MIETVPLDKIRVGDNIRRHVGDVFDLAASIASVGLLEPPIVTPAGDGMFLLVAGHRRYAAITRHLGLTEIECVVRDLDEAARIEVQLVENLQRADLGPLEEAGGYRRLQDCGLSQREVARRCGVSQANVSKKLSLLTLDEATQAEIEAGTLDVEAALKLVGRRRQPTDDSAESPVPDPGSEEQRPATTGLELDRGAGPGVLVPVPDAHPISRERPSPPVRGRDVSRRYAGERRTEDGIRARLAAERARRRALDRLAAAHPDEYGHLLETINRDGGDER